MDYWNWSQSAAVVLVILACITDFRWKMIPNWLTLSFWVSGMLFHGITSGLHGLTESLCGMTAGFVPLLVLYVCKGIGAGDVKLFGAIGAWMGMQDTFQILIYSILYGGLIGLVYLLVNRPFGKRMMIAVMSLIVPGLRTGEVFTAWTKDSEVVTKFPFMLAVLPGTATVWFLI